MKDLALLIIDVQKAIDDPKWGTRNNPHMENNIARLLEVWRHHKLSIIHIRHDSTESDSPYRPGQEGNEFKPQVAPREGETVVVKRVSSAFIGTSFESELRQRGIKDVIVTGVILNYCVDATVRVGSNLGFNMHTVSDGTAAFGLKDWNGHEHDADTIHAISLANLHGEYGEVLTTDDVIEKVKHNQGPFKTP